MVTAPVIYQGPYNFQIPQSPSEITSIADAQGELGKVYNALQQIILAVNAQSGSLQVVFSEAVAFGAMVNLYLSGGVLTARNANSGTGGSGGVVQPAHGFCNSAAGVATGKTAFVQRGVGISSGWVGLTIGSDYWLTTVNGSISVTKDTAAGHIEQHVGVAISTTALSFTISPWIQH